MLPILITGFPGLKYGTLSHLQSPSFSTSPQLLTQKRFAEYPLFNKNSCPLSHVITALSENTFFQLIIISSHRTPRNWADNSDDTSGQCCWCALTVQWGMITTVLLFPSDQVQQPNSKLRTAFFHAVNFSWVFSSFFPQK